MGFFDFFRKKEEAPTIIQNEVKNYDSDARTSKTQVNINDIAYREMEPSKATCDGIITTPIPNKTIEYAKPKHMKFTNLTMNFFRKNV